MSGYSGVFRKTREGFFRNFLKKVFWKFFGRRVLPKVTKGQLEEHFFRKSSETPSSRNFPEEVVLPESFRKKGSSGCPLNISEELSGRATSSGKFPKELLLPEVFFLNIVLYFFKWLIILFLWIFVNWFCLFFIWF